MDPDADAVYVPSILFVGVSLMPDSLLPPPETPAWQRLIEAEYGESGSPPVPDGYAVSRTRVGWHLHRDGIDVARAVAELNEVEPHRWRMRLSVDSSVPDVPQVEQFLAGLPADLASSVWLDLRGWGPLQPEYAVAMARARAARKHTGGVVVPAAGLTYRPQATQHIHPINAQGQQVLPDEAVEYLFDPPPATDQEDAVVSDQQQDSITETSEAAG
jgi:hypothetical protein